MLESLTDAIRQQLITEPILAQIYVNILRHKATES